MLRSLDTFIVSFLLHRFNFPDGTLFELSYVADENGYRPESPFIPTDHPLPAHVYELLRIAEEQRAQGITFDRK